MKTKLTLILILFNYYFSYGQVNKDYWTKYYVIAKDGLNLWKDSLTQTNLICVIPYLENVELLEKPKIITDTLDCYMFYPSSEYKPYDMCVVGSWLKIKYKEYEGYAFSGYLRIKRFEQSFSYLNKGFGLAFVGTDCADNVHRNNNINWYGIFKDSDKFIMKEVSLHYYNDEGSATGYGISTDDNRNLVFVIGSEFDGVIEGEIDGSIFPYSLGDFSGKNVNTSIPKNFEIRNENKLVLKYLNKEQILNTEFSRPSRLLWQGDIDRDNIDDYIIVFGEDKGYYAVLFLSSQAKENEIVKAVAVYYYGYCC
ncbi:MAG: hypothetical protein KDC79_02690 [Cyclobacteriaceae bacterium]|nr:hypothetical protein [Cyclobacteriaceae bacterium]